MDNVGSKQMQQIRIALRGRAVVLMGKNTMMRKAIRGHLDNNPDLERLLPHIRGNIGFVFTKEELGALKAARAKPGEKEAQHVLTSERVAELREMHGLWKQ